MYKIQPNKLEYFMSKTGTIIDHPLMGWSKEKVSSMFTELETNIKEGRFDPKPSQSNCRFCDVSESCEFRWRN